MGSAMKMSNYEMDLDSMDEEYGDEIMSAGWNPEVDQVCQQLQLLPVGEHAHMHMEAEPSPVIAELFLRRMYSYQH